MYEVVGLEAAVIARGSADVDSASLFVPLENHLEPQFTTLKVKNSLVLPMVETRRKFAFLGVIEKLFKLRFCEHLIAPFWVRSRCLQLQANFLLETQRSYSNSM
jgi:hypothetical protein